MTNLLIYQTALALLGETDEQNSCADYRARAPLLLRVIVSRLSAVSELIDGNTVSDAELSLGGAFPLAKSLAWTAAEMLASMLILDELPDLAARLNQSAVEELAKLGSEKGNSDIGRIREVYGL